MNKRIRPDEKRVHRRPNGGAVEPQWLVDGRTVTSEGTSGINFVVCRREVVDYEGWEDKERIKWVSW